MLLIKLDIETLMMAFLSQNLVDFNEFYTLYRKEKGKKNTWLRRIELCMTCRAGMEWVVIMSTTVISKFPVQALPCIFSYVFLKTINLDINILFILSISSVCFYICIALCSCNKLVIQSVVLDYNI